MWSQVCAAASTFADYLWFRQIAQLIRCEIITEEEVKRLCIKAREILIEEANVQVVDSPVTVSRLPVHATSISHSSCSHVV